MDRKTIIKARTACRPLVFCLLLAGLVSLFPRAAKAGVLDTFDGAIDAIQGGFDFIWPGDIEVEDFSVRLGLGIGTTPDYSGSDDYRFRIVPLVDIRYKDHWALQGTKLRYNVLRRGGFYAGPLVNFRFGRDQKRNQALEGLGDISDTVDLGAFVEYRKNSLVANADIRAALGAKQGLTAQVTVAQGLYKSKNFAVGGAVRAIWGSAKHIQTNFGITEAQALASGHPEFNAGGGISSIGVSLLGRYQLSERWRIESLIASSGWSEIPVTARW